MKKTHLLLLLCLVCGYGAQAQAQPEKEVAAAVEAFRTAMVSADRAALDNLAAPQLSYGHSSGKIEGKAEFVETIASGKSDFVSIDLTDDNITVVGNTAIARHKLAAQTNDGGNPGNVNLGVMLVWQKNKGKWQLLARQAFKL